MSLVQLQEKTNPYFFIPEEKVEQFEEIARMVYKEAVEHVEGIPVLGRYPFFDEDMYRVSEVLFDFAQDIHYITIEKTGVFPGTMKDWTDEQWEEARDALNGDYPFLKNYLLDDLSVYWNSQNMTYIDEHRIRSESIYIENKVLQEVW